MRRRMSQRHCHSHAHNGSMAHRVFAVLIRFQIKQTHTQTSKYVGAVEPRFEHSAFPQTLFSLFVSFARQRGHCFVRSLRRTLSSLALEPDAISGLPDCVCGRRCRCRAHQGSLSSAPILRSVVRRIFLCSRPENELDLQFMCTWPQGAFDTSVSKCQPFVVQLLKCLGALRNPRLTWQTLQV